MKKRLKKKITKRLGCKTYLGYYNKLLHQSSWSWKTCCNNLTELDVYGNTIF